MGTEIDASDAQGQLPALLKRIERGEHFIITKGGQRTAHLLPVRRVNPARRREALDQLKHLPRVRLWTCRKTID